MAKNERLRENIKPSSYFLGCFGFSRKIYSEKPMATAEDGGEKKMMKKKTNKRISRWFTSSKFPLKKSQTKLSSIEETEKSTYYRVGDETDKQKPFSVIRRLSDRKNIPVDVKKAVVNHEIKQTKPKDLEDIVLDRSKHIETLALIREDTCQEQISNSTRNDKPDLNPNRARNGSRDPVIGISIIVLTLIVMLIWGRLCAILCTSAWCYFQPRLRNAAALAKRKRSGGDGSSASVPDLNSESYKKKVVLDGFLGRQNRVSLS